MPGGDRTGPTGWGLLTGRGAGFCAGNAVPGYMNPRHNRGGRFYAARGGRGRGYRNRYWATGMPGWQRMGQGLPNAYGYAPPTAPYEPTLEQEITALRGQVEFMEQGINKARERIKGLEQKKTQGQK